MRNVGYEEAIDGDKADDAMHVIEEGDHGDACQHNAKAALQDTRTRHWRFYAERHRQEHHGYYPFMYRAALDARLRLDAAQGGR